MISLGSFLKCFTPSLVDPHVNKGHLQWFSGFSESTGYANLETNELHRHAKVV